MNSETLEQLNNRTIEDIKRLGKATDVFYFKQFCLKDDRSTMRVGTDAVLLGAAVDIIGARNILEIGTGCGIIALMMAQRSNAMIDAIEIDADSVRQAQENVTASPWQEKIRIIHSSLQEFSRSNTKKYDLVISNPPYFSQSLKSGNERKDISRHDDQLNFKELIIHSKELMTKSGNLWVVLPVKESTDFIDTATKHDLFVNYKLLFIPKKGKAPNRNVLQFTKEKPAGIFENVMVHRNTDGTFSRDFIQFMQDYYIDF